MEDKIRDAFAAPLEGLLNHFLPLSILYLVSSALLVYLLSFFYKHKFRYSASALREMYLHPSAVFDYYYYVLSRIIKTLLIGVMVLPALSIDKGMVDLLTSLFGARPEIPAPTLAIVIETLCYVIALDFGYWLHHWLFHRVSWLWEFHKAHHSAEVLTPFTTLRAHPLEEFITGSSIVISTSVMHGIFAYFYGKSAHSFELLQINALIFLFYIFFFNLRHTHVWIPIGGFWGRILQSPAHHQIHHSVDPRHWHKNFGFCLAIWDFLFGTLYVPEQNEKIKFGLGEMSKDYHRLDNFLFLPFKKIAQQRVRPNSSSDSNPIV